MSPEPDWVPSPRETLLPEYTALQRSKLAYPPDFYPGARDVTTPYGVMRVYEWGPDDGKKVLLIHGDSTPAPLFASITGALVGCGCRVMTLDLWGRGYSDAPRHVRYDVRLFTTQVAFALVSSPLSWTGAASAGFSVVGFSLGGGITMSFTALFPGLVHGLALLGPAGILRRVPKEYIAERILDPDKATPQELRKTVAETLGVRLEGSMAGSTLGGSGAATEVSQEPISLRLNVHTLSQWQFDHHRGFVDAFDSTCRYGPAMGRQSDWLTVGKIVTGQLDPSLSSDRELPLKGGRIAMIFGESDTIVSRDEVVEDFSSLCPGVKEHLDIRTVPGGHDFPVHSGEEVSKHIMAIWAI